MITSEQACLEALREAAERLGESPIKADYEELGLTPASATIIRTVGGWNEAKERAGLETNPSTGTRVGPKPRSVDCTDEEWAAMSVDQRWHYRKSSTTPSGRYGGERGSGRGLTSGRPSGGVRTAASTTRHVSTVITSTRSEWPLRE